MKKIFNYLVMFLAVVLIVGFFTALFSDKNNTINNDTTLEHFTSEDSESNNNSNDSNQNFSSFVYFAFGDSITYGSDCYNGLAQMDDPYPSLVASDLHLKSYNNFGVVASTIATDVVNTNNYTLPSIYDCVLDANSGADIISVMGGVNDYNTNVELGTIEDVSTTTFYGSLNAICKELKTKYPESFIFFMTPYKEFPYQQTTCDTENEKGYILEDYANAIKVVCGMYSIPVLDMFTYGNYEIEFSSNGSDGIHPSQEFIREYTAPQIAEFIRQNYRGK